MERDRKTFPPCPRLSPICWAKKVRQFLHLKSLMFNMTVGSKPELLSLFTTSNIKAIISYHPS